MRASFVAAALVLVGCASAPPTPAEPGPVLDAGPQLTVMPDFSLEDRNPASPTSGTQVSPRAHEGAITGWYFSHTT